MKKLIAEMTINGIRSRVVVISASRKNPKIRHLVSKVDHDGMELELLATEDYTDKLTALDQHDARMEREEERLLDEREYVGIL